MSLRNALRNWRDRRRLSSDDIHDAVAMQALAPLASAFLPWTSFSMRPAAIVELLGDIEFNQRRSIVECGSGNSTLFIARMLAAQGEGEILSLDHDHEWAAITTRLLVREGLDDRARVVYAPLVNGWYDVARIPQVPAIDLLIVDGPPAFSRATRAARQPALGYFADNMTEGATVALDDASRPGERRTLDTWRAQYGIDFRIGTSGLATGAFSNTSS